MSNLRWVWINHLCGLPASAAKLLAIVCKVASDYSTVVNLRKPMFVSQCLGGGDKEVITHSLIWYACYWHSSSAAP